MIEIKHRAGFLDKIHLFHGLNEEELTGIALTLEQRSLPADTVIFERGAKPDGFYMIYKGRVKVTRPRENKKGEDFLAWLGTGDYFGEEALFETRNRSATIRTVEDSVIFFLPRRDFENLLIKYDRLKPNFQVAIKSRRLARATMFKWLGREEVVYFVARRHKIRLYQVLLAPFFALALPMGLFAWSYASGAITPVIISGLLLFAILLWAAWVTIDWSNDYYIVTNHRVVWVERVIGIYDSRQEAPLSTILSVNVETDFFGRALDYGNVSVRTFVGNIKFDYVDHPNQAADMIRELWDRTKLRGSQAQKNAMKNAIRAKLGMPVHKATEEELPPVVQMEDKEVQKRGLISIVLGNLFKLRTEDGGTVIYHKHWIVLLRQMASPLIFFLILLGLMISRIWNLAQDPNNAILERLEGGGFRPDTIIVSIPLLMLPFFAWMVWEYIDWNNDIFMVTPEEIMDLDKKPLGTEERRTAQIENILSTEYKRIGLMGYLFNFGTVYIVVGGTKLSFQDVLDPASVQSDINRRRMARIAKKNEEAANVDRERMATWLVAYHQNRDDFNVPEEVPNEMNEEDDDELARLRKAAGQDLVDDIDAGVDDMMDDQSLDGMEG